MLRLLLFLIASCVTASVMAGERVDSLLATAPVIAAERAYATGDRKYIVVPMCGNPHGEVLPGWPLESSPKHLEAIENGHRPVTCHDLGDVADSKEFRRVAKYAELYNRRLRELSEGAGE